MLDYVIVGFGLSGLAFVEQLENNNKSYLVYENHSQASSRVAGGLYNPVILKRFTAAWNALEQLEYAVPFYKKIEDKLKESLVYPMPVLRRFNSVEEQNTWFEACDKPILNHFLSLDLQENENDTLDIPYHYGRVMHTGRVDVKKMLSAYEKRLAEHGKLLQESFNYDALTIKEDYIVYKEIKSKHIVFAEGFGIKKNPYFKYLPVPGNKGEYILIKCKELKLQEAVKSSVFIIPLGDDVYKVGATYNNQDKTAVITKSARKEIKEKLKKVLKLEFEILDQVSGIRPSVKDRRPLVGTHPDHKSIHILNGLGSRGILAAPKVAEQLYSYIENNASLDPEIDLKRYHTLR